MHPTHKSPFPVLAYILIFLVLMGHGNQGKYSTLSKPIFVLGDIHGDFDKALAILTQEKLVQKAPNGRYQFTTHTYKNGFTFIQIGDLVHRGAFDRSVVELFKQLKESATGPIDFFQIIGNHETYELTGKVHNTINMDSMNEFLSRTNKGRKGIEFSSIPSFNPENQNHIRCFNNFKASNKGVSAYDVLRMTLFMNESSVANENKGIKDEALKLFEQYIRRNVRTNWVWKSGDKQGEKILPNSSDSAAMEAARNYLEILKTQKTAKRKTNCSFSKEPILTLSQVLTPWPPAIP